MKKRKNTRITVISKIRGGTQKNLKCKYPILKIIAIMEVNKNI